MSQYEERLKELISFPLEIYDEIKRFYRNIYLTKKYKYIVLTTRRSFVLYKIFEKIFKEEGQTTKNIVFTCHSFSLLKKEDILKDKLLIVDDIMINGRTVKKLFKRLNDKISIDSHEELYHAIDIFAINEKATVFNYFDKKYNLIRLNIITESIWRLYSNCFNELVELSGIGYTSFVNTYYFEKKDLNVFKNSLNAQTQKDNFFSFDIYKKYNINSKIYFFEKKPSNNDTINDYIEFLYSYDIKPCVRLYDYKDCEFDKLNSLIIPYVFLPPIKSNELENYFINIVSNLPISELKIFDLEIIGNEKDSIKNRIEKLMNNTKNDFEYLYMVLVYILSSFLMNLFSNKLNLENNIQLDSGQSLKIDLQYKKDKKNNLKNLIKNQEDYIVNDGIIINTAERECIEKFAKTIREYYLSNNSELEISQNTLCDIISNYLFRMRKVDQIKALNKKDRTKGIRIWDIINIRKYDNSINFASYLNDNTIYAVIINNWDSGNGSGVIRIFDDNNDSIIDCATINGEHIVMYPFSDKQVSYDYKLFYYYFRNSYKEKMYDFAKYMDKIFHTRDYSIFYSLITKGMPNDFADTIENIQAEKGVQDNTRIIRAFSDR